jgi:hypothetical protein
MSQCHFDPATYREKIRREIPRYDQLQDAIAAATSPIAALSILDLGTGTGETLSRVLPLHPSARVVGIDESDGMLDVARTRVAAALEPGGRFVLGDVVVPADGGAVVIPLTDDWDKPSTVAEQVGWLEGAGLRAAVVWQEDDMALFTADRPAD